MNNWLKTVWVFHGLFLLVVLWQPWKCSWMVSILNNAVSYFENQDFITTPDILLTRYFSCQDIYRHTAVDVTDFGNLFCGNQGCTNWRFVFGNIYGTFYIYIWVSVHHKSIIYNKPTRCNSGSIVFINNYKYALHVSDALCVHHQEHYKL